MEAGGISSLCFTPGTPGSTRTSPEVGQEEKTPCPRPPPDPPDEKRASLPCQLLLGGLPTTPRQGPGVPRESSSRSLRGPHLTPVTTSVQTSRRLWSCYSPDPLGDVFPETPPLGSEQGRLTDRTTEQGAQRIPTHPLPLPNDEQLARGRDFGPWMSHY